ncbi:unnamed protein product [Caenorhabditis angaria]|uniref:Tudor domain-containing protein n=1 Tax=Caenorhabditis angaria TaxID=860376 RepID=A0A9P1IFN5_9PELO|nr:unnamed protein product [Caenorhabditis angaria]
MLTSTCPPISPILVHPTRLPTHLPPPPFFVQTDGTLYFPPGFLPPPFPAVSDEEELHALTSTTGFSDESSSASSISGTDSEPLFCCPNVGVAPKQQTQKQKEKKSVVLTLMPLTGDEDHELRMYAKAQGEAKARKFGGRRNSSGSSTYSGGGPMTPTTSEYFSETASSQDSGRATGGLASSLSPMDENGQVINDDINDLLPMYEFEIPNSLVGLVIGVKGKTIKELSVRTNVRMLIRQHHTPEKVKTHQICQVRGKRDEINHCLQMLRRRFPSPRFPELNLQPVLPPPLPNNSFDMLSTQPTWLTLPEDIKCEIAVSAIIDPSHFFIHQPSHPSFNSLCHLDMYMLRLYGEHSNLPELPTPCQNGLLCAAPVVNAWFRAVTVQYYEDTDEVFVKFVDYGGYSKMARQDLRQIRTDLMSLPFQSTEVMLAHVRPVDGTTNWSEPAMKEFNALATGRVISAKLVGYAIDTRIPMVELYIPTKDANGDVTEIRFDQLLMEKGLARTADPSKMVRPSNASIAATQIGAKRPSLTSQTSQTTVVC